MPFTPTRHAWMLGPLGRIVAVPGPAVPNATPSFGVTEDRLLDGSVRTQRPARAPRSYDVQWDYLSDADRSWIEQCAYGYAGTPLYWVDPLVLNQLPSKVSTVPELTAFTTPAVGTVTLAADSGAPGSGLRSVWVIPAGGGLKYYGPAVSVPVPGGSGLTFTGSVRVARSVAATVEVEVRFSDIAGAYISSLNSGFIAAAASPSSTRISATGTIPATAATALIRIATSAGSTTLYADSWQAEFGALSTFTPGPGLAKVSVLSYQPDVYLSGITSIRLSMVEVG